MTLLTLLANGISPIVVNEPPPLDLSVLVTTPGNVRTRWGWDDPNPDLVPTALSFGTAMPGGFTQCNVTLERLPERFYADDEELSRLTVLGVGGSVAWQGRIEKLPDTGGYEAQESPEATGYQAALEDDNSVREIFVDGELSKWEEPSTARRIQLAEGNFSPGSASVSTDPTSHNPALVQVITGNWASPAKPMVESMYAAQGLAIAFVWATMFGNKAMQEAQTGGAQVRAEIVANEDANYTSSDGTGNLGVLGIAKYTSLPTEPFYMVRVWFEETPGGVAELAYELFWEQLTVYGRHGLTLYGGAPGGVLASDAVAYTLAKWAPEIAFSTGTEGTIKPSSFIVPQLAFLEPTTVAEVIKQATRFELPDWAVWEGPTFYMNPQGERGRKWKTRVGPSQLQESGPQISRLWNGVCVQYTDVTGKTRMVGPPGFAGGTFETEDSNLLETDPENPLNELGIRKWALLKMGTTTVEGAKAVGRIYLQEQQARELQGQAALVGYVEDEQGTTWPAWMVRAGDTIRFIDASITGPRKIVNTSYDDTTKTNTIALEQPPENLQAILERLAVSIENVATS